MLLNKCITLEPKEMQHLTELRNLKSAIQLSEDMNNAYNKKDFEKCEEISKKLLDHCPESSHTKLFYVESLLKNLKINQAISFLTNKLNDDEKKNEEFEYLLALALYYDTK